MSVAAERPPLPIRHFGDEAAFDPTEPEPRLLDFDNRPVSALVNVVAARVMEILGPCCWAALIVLFLYAELTCR